MEKIIIISIIILVVIAIVILRIRFNGRGIRKVDGVTRKLRRSNKKRQSNDRGIRTDIGAIEEKTGGLRTNNGTRSDIDREAGDILKGAKHR